MIVSIVIESPSFSQLTLGFYSLTQNLGVENKRTVEKDENGKLQYLDQSIGRNFNQTKQNKY